jgi:AcrR family transcriptional regulator
MSDRARLASPSRERRSHAERTAETRARIMSAVVESIAEVGFQRTTATEIARRAGITWGAVQHHFGGKDGILLAVLEDSFEHFAELLADIPTEDTPLEKRVGLFLDRAWEHFGSSHYRSTFEILLNYAGPAAGPDPELLSQTEMFTAWNRIWTELFGDAGLPRRRVVMLQHYTVAVLSGLASMKMLEGPTARIRQTELDLLKQTLVRELSP